MFMFSKHLPSTAAFCNSAPYFCAIRPLNRCKVCYFSLRALNISGSSSFTPSLFTLMISNLRLMSSRSISFLNFYFVLALSFKKFRILVFIGIRTRLNPMLKRGMKVYVYTFGTTWSLKYTVVMPNKSLFIAKIEVILKTVLFFGNIFQYKVPNFSLKTESSSLWQLSFKQIYENPGKNSNIENLKVYTKVSTPTSTSLS